jgi:hypothetical protein
MTTNDLTPADPATQPADLFPDDFYGQFRVWCWAEGISTTRPDAMRMYKQECARAAQEDSDMKAESRKESRGW